jgi:dTDP-4-dehydrorhamnose reductase
VIACDRSALDITDRAQIAAALAAHAPDAVINAAAYTAVDRAETERDAAFAINATGAQVLAEACAARGARLVHVSTDYVFDGTADRPYREDDAPSPPGVYGASKLAGERAVIAARGIVVRTSWLFSATGVNFVRTILRLATERSELRVVADQHGCPTFADDLADAALGLAARAVAGAPLAPLYHACGDSSTTWHGFATAIVDAARQLRPLACERVAPISTAEYPTPARRPARSILDTTRIRALGIVPAPWPVGLAIVLKELLS